MNQINTAAALSEIIAECDRGARFIYTDFTAKKFGQADSNAAFKQADLAARGYKKGRGVWIMK